MSPLATEGAAAIFDAAEPQAAEPRAAQPQAAERHARRCDSLLDAVELGTQAERVTLRSGRRYELEAGSEADRITVRSASGSVLLRVTVGDDGPLLCFESAAIELSAHDRLTLSAPELTLTAEDLKVQAGSCEQQIEGNRHTHVRGEDRLEAGAVAVQASERGVALRAMEHIALDGEHIGLNDDPCPAPFEWSEIAETPGATKS